MAWLKKIGEWLTRPNFNVVRILVVSASVVVVSVFFMNMRTTMWVIGEQNRRIAQRERDLRGETLQVPEKKMSPVTFSVNGAQKSNNLVVVDVTLHNPNDRPVYFSAFQLRLKDERLMPCDVLLAPYLLEKEKKPVLKDGNLLAGEDVRGIRIYSCSDPDVKKFSLIYGDLAGSTALAVEVVPAEIKITPSLSVNGSKKVGGIVLIDVTVRNPGEQTKYLTLDQFRLKDERSMICDGTFDAHLLEKEKKSALKGGNLQPGEEVRGVLQFACSDPAVKKFALAYGTDNIVTDIVPTEFI